MTKWTVVLPGEKLGKGDVVEIVPWGYSNGDKVPEYASGDVIEFSLGGSVTGSANGSIVSLNAGDMVIEQKKHGRFNIRPATQDDSPPPKSVSWAPSQQWVVCEPVKSTDS
jgi:hypothetical protein